MCIWLRKLWTILGNKRQGPFTICFYLCLSAVIQSTFSFIVGYLHLWLVICEQMNSFLQLREQIFCYIFVSCTSSILLFFKEVILWFGVFCLCFIVLCCIFAFCKVKKPTPKGVTPSHRKDCFFSVWNTWCGVESNLCASLWNRRYINIYFYIFMCMYKIYTLHLVNRHTVATAVAALF